MVELEEERESREDEDGDSYSCVLCEFLILGVAILIGIVWGFFLFR
jgi:hypothetical protein